MVYLSVLYDILGIHRVIAKTTAESRNIGRRFAAKVRGILPGVLRSGGRQRSTLIQSGPLS